MRTRDIKMDKFLEKCLAETGNRERAKQGYLCMGGMGVGGEGHSYRGRSQFRERFVRRAAKNAWRIDRRGSEEADGAASRSIPSRTMVETVDRIRSKHSIVVAVLF